jgi:hypothetical protein
LIERGYPYLGQRKDDSVLKRQIDSREREAERFLERENERKRVRLLVLLLARRGGGGGLSSFTGLTLTTLEFVNGIRRFVF